MPEAWCLPQSREAEVSNRGHAERTPLAAEGSAATGGQDGACSSLSGTPYLSSSPSVDHVPFPSPWALGALAAGLAFAAVVACYAEEAPTTIVNRVPAQAARPLQGALAKMLAVAVVTAWGLWHGRRARGRFLLAQTAGCAAATGLTVSQAYWWAWWTRLPDNDAGGMIALGPPFEVAIAGVPVTVVVWVWLLGCSALVRVWMAAVARRRRP